MVRSNQKYVLEEQKENKVLVSGNITRRDKVKVNLMNFNNALKKTTTMLAENL